MMIIRFQKDDNNLTSNRTNYIHFRTEGKKNNSEENMFFHH